MLPLIFKNTIFLIVANLIDKSAYVLIFAIIARKLTKSEFGAYNLVMTLIFIGGMLVSLGMENIIIREVAKNRTRAKTYFNNALFLVFIFSILTWPLVICLAIILHYGSEITFLLSFGGVVFIFMGFSQIASAIIKAYERMEFFAGIGLCVSIIALAINLLVLKMGWSLAALIVAFLIVEGFRSSVLIFVVQRHFVPIVMRFDKKVAMEIFKLTVPFTFLMIYQALLHRTDLLMMGWLKPFDEVAIYGTAARFADFLSLVSGSMVAALYPALSARIGSNVKEVPHIYSDSIGIFAILGFGATFAVTVLAEPIIIFVFGNKYLAGAITLRWLAWAFLFSVLSGPVGILLLATGDQMRRLLILSIIVLCSNIALNLWFIPLYSYNGAALSTFLCAVLGFIGRYSLSRKYFGQLPNLLRIIWRPLSASLLMSCILILLRELHLIALITIGGATYFCALAFLGEFQQARYIPFRAKLSQITEKL